MILDGYLVFSSAQAITATAASTNIIDLQNARDMGVNGEDFSLKVFVSVGTAAASTGSSTMTVAFQGSTDASTWDTYYTSPAITKAQMAANTRILSIDLPRVPIGFSKPRYYRLNYTVAVADFTAGTLNAAIVLADPQISDYPIGNYPAN